MRLTTMLVAVIALGLWSASPAVARVAYESAAGDVVVAADDGSSPRAIAHGLGPSVSPDGRRVAYFAATGCGCNSFVLHVIRPSGASDRVLVRRVYSPGRSSTTEPVLWSPDSRRLTVSAYGRSGGGFIVDVRTGRKRFVPSEVYFAQGSFAPDSSQIVYEDAGGLCSQRVLLYPGPRGRPRSLGCGGSPAWGCHGVAFARDGGITVARRPGGPEHHLVAPEPGRTLAPIGWSGDGNVLLAFQLVDEDTYKGLLVDRRTRAVQTLPGSYTSVDAISRDASTVLAETGGDVVAVGSDGTTTVLAHGASHASWNR